VKNPVHMAVIGAAHGIKGEVRVKTFTGDPTALGDYGPLYSSDGRTFEVIDVRPQGMVAVVRFKGVSDRNAAEALNGTELFIDRSALPDGGEEDEFYHTDLIGLAVRDEGGRILGRVMAVQNFGGGDILEITHDGRKGVLIPFTQAAVPEVNIADGFVCVETVAAGLVPDEDGDGVPDAGFKARPRGPKNAGGNR
jgi:16S rRNA processing protein RimM